MKPKIVERDGKLIVTLVDDNGVEIDPATYNAFQTNTDRILGRCLKCDAEIVVADGCAADHECDCGS